MKRIMIYGTGKLAEFFMESQEGKYEIIGFIETNKMSKTAFKGYSVYALDEIQDDAGVTYFMANTYLETLTNILNKGIPKERIVVLSWKMFRDYLSMKENKTDIRIDCDVADGFAEYNNSRMTNNENKYVVTKRMNQDQVIFGEVKRSEFHIDINNSDIIRNDDYARVGVLTLVISEIEKRNVKGDVAELGVYRGDFAKFINRSFPDRRLYLFDTFDGFVSEEMEFDIEKGYLEKVNYFNSINTFINNDVKMVMDKMRYPERCEIIQGRFPESRPESMENNIFAFVSLDCDLYLPIYEGLKYFYPRLSSGGYIMVHDYNNLPGVRQAVYDYEEKFGYMAKVPITDACGSLVISKN